MKDILKKIAMIFVIVIVSNFLRDTIIVAMEKFKVPEINITAEKGVAPEQVELVKQAVHTFEDVMKKDLGVTFNRDITIIIAPDNKHFARVLNDKLRIEKKQSKRLSKLVSGYSQFDDNGNTVVLNLEPEDFDEENPYYVVHNITAHELFHQMQYQLSNGDTSEEYYWIGEGSADYMSAIVCGYIGNTSYDDWKRDQLEYVAYSDLIIDTEYLFDIDDEGWTEAMEKEAVPYQVSALMYVYLKEEKGIDVGNATIKYYQLLGKGFLGKEAFLQAFGLEAKSWLGDFDAWLEREIEKV